MVAKSCDNLNEKFKCIFCNYFTSRKSSIEKHFYTSKHLNRTKINIIEQTSCDNDKLQCKNCNKIYKARNSLWYHEQKCNYIIPEKILEPEHETDELQNLTNVILDLVKSNADLQKQMLDICKNGTTVNNNTLNKNKTFNLQFFLNEQCKDAMNLMDFVKSVSLQLSDLENVTKLGYVDGIAGIIMQKLNEMDVYKRPIHCSDAKREILYVREDGIWEKESTDHTKLRKAIKGISKKNRILLNEWSESHPEANDTHNSQNLEYMLMIVQAMGGKGELVDNENKIMKKIMKNVLIEKC